MPRSNESTIRDEGRARELADRRPRETYTCENCREPFQAVAMAGRRRPRTCSPRCRVALHNKRRRAEREQVAG